MNLTCQVSARILGGCCFVDEVDIAVQARLSDARCLPLALEHNELFSETAQLQISFSAFRLACHMDNIGKTTKGPLPAAVGVLVRTVWRRRRNRRSGRACEPGSQGEGRADDVASVVSRLR